MKSQILAGAAALALIAGGASAATHKSPGAYTPPSQPVAYSKLGDYLKASPHLKAAGNWGLDSTATAAPIGSAANTSATAPQTGVAPSAPDSSAGTASSAAARAAPSPAAPATPPASDQAPAPAAPDTSAAPASPSN